MSLVYTCDRCWNKYPYSDEWRVVEVLQPTDDEAVLLSDLLICPACVPGLEKYLEGDH